MRYVLISKEKMKRSDGEIEGAEEMNVTSGRCQDALGISDPSLNAEKALQG